MPIFSVLHALSFLICLRSYAVSSIVSISLWRMLVLKSWMVYPAALSNSKRKVVKKGVKKFSKEPLNI